MSLPTVINKSTDITPFIKTLPEDNRPEVKLDETRNIMITEMSMTFLELMWLTIKEGLFTDSEVQDSLRQLQPLASDE